MKNADGFSPKEVEEIGFKFLEDRGLSRIDIEKLAESFTIDTKIMLGKIMYLFKKDYIIDSDSLHDLVKEIDVVAVSRGYFHDEDYKQAIANLEKIK